MKVKEGKIIITQKDVDKGLNITQAVMDKAMEQRFDKIREQARKYGWP